MKENREIVRAMEEMKRSGRRMALATVVRVKRFRLSPGGCQTADRGGGNTVGVISGGCLEPDVAEVAKRVMADGRPALRRYELDEELVWGLGLGCPGTVDIWIEPVSDAAARPLGRDGEDLREERGFQEGDCYGSWLRCLREERAAVLATLLEPSSSALQAGARLLIPQEGEPMGDLGDSSLNRWVIERAREKLDGLYPRSETLPFSLPEGDPMQVFFDVNLPPSNWSSSVPATMPFPWPNMPRSSDSGRRWWIRGPHTPPRIAFREAESFWPIGIPGRIRCRSGGGHLCW